MKTKVAFCLILVMTSMGCSNRSKEKTISRNDFSWPVSEVLKGKVKELSETSYKVVLSGNEVVKGSRALKIYLDSIGVTNGKEFHNENGFLTKYELLGDKNVVIETDSGVIENGKYKTWVIKRPEKPYYIVPTYNDQGQITSGNLFRTGNDTLVQKMSRSYDSTGKLIKEQLSNPKGEIQWISNFKYDTNGNLSEGEFRGKNDSLVQKNTFIYNEAGQFSTVNIVYPKLSQKWEFKYKTWDKLGNYTSYYLIINGKPAVFIERNLVYY